MTYIAKISGEALEDLKELTVALDKGSDEAVATALGVMREITAFLDDGYSIKLVKGGVTVTFSPNSASEEESDDVETLLDVLSGLHYDVKE